MKIAMAMSGGVDSSVAASMLKNMGHEVFGFMMSICDDKSVPLSNHSCCYGADKSEDIKCAKKVCEMLDIPFEIIDLKEEFNKNVLENFRAQYLMGRTPNPCVLCNSYVKFGVFPYLIKKRYDFDKFATGHYVRIEEENGKFLLKRGIEDKKDQSYFLYRLNQAQLSKILTPLGKYKKEEIRKIAHEQNLPVFNKPDSQDFYNGNYNELLQVAPKMGNIIDKSGKILGTHQGIWNFTIGQRKGIKLSAPNPLYVIELRENTNEVVVGFIDETQNNTLIAHDVNWIIEPTNTEFEADVKVRSVQVLNSALVKILSDGKIKVSFKNSQKSVAKGQSVVLYDNDKVLGGAIIAEVS